MKRHSAKGVSAALDPVQLRLDPRADPLSCCAGLEAAGGGAERGRSAGSPSPARASGTRAGPRGETEGGRRLEELGTERDSEPPTSFLAPAPHPGPGQGEAPGRPPASAFPRWRFAGAAVRGRLSGCVSPGPGGGAREKLRGPRVNAQPGPQNPAVGGRSIPADAESRNPVQRGPPQAGSGSPTLQPLCPDQASPVLPLGTGAESYSQSMARRWRLRDLDAMHMRTLTLLF
ncbi:uncharacterized protein LOC110258367 [Sus scrofa]|uniref:uncharacterized protein LOC110258367 n=1 Tax=Sus scrofa TaxID=9823 RepID=UPI000A2AF75F|nr:uncharacterized protein LOC110258367 [Sus scrofa]